MVPPTTIEVLSDDEVEATVPPVLAGGEPESLPRLRRQWILKLHCQEAARGSMAVSIFRGLQLSLRCCPQNGPLRTLFGLYIRRGNVEVTFRFGYFLGGLEELKVLHLKERRRRLKNEVFRVCIMTPLS